MQQKLWTRSFFMVMVINFLLFLSMNMINPSFPLYFQELGLGETASGICISIFTIGSVLIRPVSGDVLDHLGRRSVFFVSMVLLALAIFSYSLTAVLVWIFCLRLAHGLCWSFASTAVSTMATDIIPRPLMGKGISIFSLSMGLALAIAPALAVELMARIAFGGMVRISAGILLVAMVLALAFPFARTPERRPRRKEARRHPGAIFERSAMLPAVIMGTLTLTMGAVTTYVPLFATNLDLGNSGLFFSFYAAGLLIVRACIGSFMDRFGVLTSTLPTVVLMFAGLVALTCASNLPLLLASGLLYGLGIGGAQACMQSLSVINAPAERFGAANATFFTGFDIGLGVGALLAGVLIEHLGFRPMFLIQCLFTIVAFVLLLKFRPHKIDPA